jgi:pimeloyl-ACP methyl ester carboxylesterase
MKTNFVKAFCTPSFLPLTDFDTKVLNDAEKVELSFEYDTIHCYTWGQGKTVLLAHGWGSRASHLGLIARTLAMSGFRVVAFDAPAHSSMKDGRRNKLSNFFEYSRALSLVANKFAPLYALAGHSLGAVASVFAVTGQSLVADYKIDVDKLVLIGLPPKMEYLVDSFCRNNNLNEMDCAKLKVDLEKSFNFFWSDFSVESALNEINADILLTHDTEDEEFSFDEIVRLQESNPDIELFTSKGFGHQKLVMNRQVVARINEYLLEK